MYIKPRVVVVDESEYWEDRLVEQAGAIYGVYVYDTNLETHLCSFQGSYYLCPLEVAIRNHETCPEEIRDEIEQEWSRSTDPDYTNTSTIDEMPVFPLPTERCKAADYDEVWDDLVEAYRCDGVNYELPPKEESDGPV